MNNTHNRKKTIAAALGAAAAALAAPAMLFVGAGTAHAGGSVWNNADYLGTTVFVQSDGQTFGNCTYSAVPLGPGIPPVPVNFILESSGTPAQLWFPGIKLNTTWTVKVRCNNGPDILTQTVTSTSGTLDG